MPGTLRSPWDTSPPPLLEDTVLMTAARTRDGRLRHIISKYEFASLEGVLTQHGVAYAIDMSEPPVVVKTLRSLELLTIGEYLVDAYVPKAPASASQRGKVNGGQMADMHIFQYDDLDTE